jgi:preprotein translocase subunit SecA
VRRRYELFKKMLARVRRNVIYNAFTFQPTRLTPQEGADQNGKGGGRAQQEQEKKEQKAVAGAK